MKIIIDVNILLSALIRDSLTRKIIKNSGIEFYFPETSFDKILKHKEEIIAKSGLKEEEIIKILLRLSNSLALVSKEKLKENLEEAEKIIGKIDEEDIPFIACALSLGPEAVIWTNDKHFKKQNKIKIITTSEIISEI